MNCEKIPDGIAPIRFDMLEQCAALIRESFATVAVEFDINEQNCSNHTSFIKPERLEKEFATGYLMYGYYINGRLVGYVSLSEAGETEYELHHLAVLPEYRHKSVGWEILDFCVQKAKELGAKKIKLGMIEENARLKDWYKSYGFTHTGTKTFAHLPFTAGYMELDL